MSSLDSAAAPAQRPRLAINAFGYCHLLILLGIIAIAAALRSAIGQPFEPLPVDQAVALGGGTAIFLLGQALFRRALGIRGEGGRAVVAAGASLTIPIGHQLGLCAQVSVLVGLLIAMLMAESRSDHAPDTVTSDGRGPRREAIGQ